MAKQIEGVYENILECATKEFLEKGYTDASLRTIAAIVEPVAKEFLSHCLNMQETFLFLTARCSGRRWESILPMRCLT